MARRGFTLVELLVVVSIIGILIGLCCLRSSRQGKPAAVSSVQITLGRLPLRLSNHVDVYGAFPPGSSLCSDPNKAWCVGGQDACQLCQGPNWNHLLFEFLEEKAAYDEVVWFAKTTPTWLMTWNMDTPTITPELARRTLLSICARVPNSAIRPWT